MASTTLADGAEVRPDARFLFGHPAHFIALGFGAGLSRIAPGTIGTLVAFPIFDLLYPRLPDPWFAALLLALFVVGSWACDRTGRDLRVHDHGGMVFDEIVAFLLVLFMLPPGLLWQAFGFLLFRAFDIVKPMPIRYYDQTVKNGFGVMFDDLIAACYALFVLAAWKAMVL
ncbi:MAG: phosphatidylglycerophosphatase A [Betaproteobacteria bacterium]